MPHTREKLSNVRNQGFNIRETIVRHQRLLFSQCPSAPVVELWRQCVPLFYFQVLFIRFVQAFLCMIHFTKVPQHHYFAISLTYPGNCVSKHLTICSFSSCSVRGDIRSFVFLKMPQNAHPRQGSCQPVETARVFEMLLFSRSPSTSLSSRSRSICLLVAHTHRLWKGRGEMRW